ncbi:MAG: hypothetical protein RLZZ387_5272 [Chloroflexota bacterium]
MIGNAMVDQQLIGQTIDSYTIEALIGRGGMSRVYRAFDRKLQRPVALKVLAEPTASQEFAQRFQHEALVLARLRHPNIVAVYDLGLYAGVSYMVQELLPGPTLEQQLHGLAERGGRLGRAEAVAIVSQLAAGLDAAHAAGVIHRDVKPSNAIWGAAGTLVLTDFGIARSQLADARQTQTGVICGTPAYLSPEQAEGRPVTPSSDIYALGVVLYELLAGRAPFEGPTPLSVLMKHLQSPPPPLEELRPDLPPPVYAVVYAALAKDPAQRYARAVDLARALVEAWPADAEGVESLAASSIRPVSGATVTPHDIATIAATPSETLLSEAGRTPPVPERLDAVRALLASERLHGAPTSVWERSAAPERHSAWREKQGAGRWRRVWPSLLVVPAVVAGLLASAGAPPGGDGATPVKSVLAADEPRTMPPATAMATATASATVTASTTLTATATASATLTATATASATPVPPSATRVPPPASDAAPPVNVVAPPAPVETVPAPAEAAPPIPPPGHGGEIPGRGDEQRRDSEERKDEGRGSEERKGKGSEERKDT